MSDTDCLRFNPTWRVTSGLSLSPGSVEEEDVEWRINGVDEGDIDVRAHYEPYSEWFFPATNTTFQAGDLRGHINSSTAYGLVDVDIDLPGTPDNGGPIFYTAWAEMAASLPKEQQDLIIEQFKQAMAHLAPSQLALQSTPTAIPAPPGVQACSATNLSASVDGQGCTGFFCGTLTLTNKGKSACSVSGRPVMKYISHDGKTLPVSQSSLPSFSGNDNSAVVLKPGDTTTMAYRSSHGSCSAQETAAITATWVMEMAGIVGPITVMPETTLHPCREMLPSVAYMEVGTFDGAR